MAQKSLLRLLEILWRPFYRLVWRKLGSTKYPLLSRIAVLLVLVLLVAKFYPEVSRDIDIPFADARESTEKEQAPSAKSTTVDTQELVVCSQNLFRFSDKDAKRSNKLRREKQKKFLITRMKDAACDVVALQELMGGGQTEALEVAVELADALGKRSGRKYRAFAGRSKNKYSTNGFLVAEDAGTVEDVQSHWRQRLPKLQPRGPSATFTRGPLSIVLKRPSGSKVVLVSFHFKSRHQSWKDHTRTDFESIRMQEAAGLRSIIRSLRREYGREVEVIALGDRNSGADSAAADILRGSRMLSDFDSPRKCRLSPEETAECDALPEKPSDLVDLFALRQTEHPRKYTKGSFRYRGKESVFDDIHVTPGLLSRVRRADGTLAIGFRGQFLKGSDHKLVWARVRL